MPRFQGGLGIWDMKSTNLALLTKLGWAFLNNAPKVWVQQLHQKYIPYENFFFFNPHWFFSFLVVAGHSVV
jgi:hypothetical protein